VSWECQKEAIGSPGLFSTWQYAQLLQDLAL